MDASVRVEYLTFRVDSLLVDAAVSTHGIAVQMGLRGIQVIDKLHVGKMLFSLRIIFGCDCLVAVA